jgi:hypothetical protein
MPAFLKNRALLLSIISALIVSISVLLMEDKTKAEGTIDDLRDRVTVLETNYSHITDRLDKIWEEVRQK